MKLEDFYINYDELKVGDKVWDILLQEWCKVRFINKDKSVNYPISIEYENNMIVHITEKGNHLISDKAPRYYKSNPFEHLGKERVNCSKEKVISILTNRTNYVLNNHRDFYKDSFMLSDAWLKQHYPSLTFEEPFKERVMMVSDDNKTWFKGKVYEIDGEYFTKAGFNGFKASGWKYAKELPTITEYTIEQATAILASFTGKDINQIKIK